MHRAYVRERAPEREVSPITQCVCAYTNICEADTLGNLSGPTLAAGLELKFLVCINVLYVLVPVLVHVLLDGSGHDSAEIDGTVERHATSAPSKQPVPAPRHSTTKSSTKPEFRLEFSDAPRKRKTVADQPSQEAESPSKGSPKSKIPVKTDSQLNDDYDIITRSITESSAPQPVSRTIRYISREYKDGELTKETVEKNVSPKSIIRTVKSGDVADVTMRRAEIPPSVDQIRRTTATIVTSDPSVDPEKLEELLKTGGVVETVRTVTLSAEDDDSLQPITREEVVRRINQVASTLPSEIFDFGDNLPESSTTTSTTVRTDRSESEGVVKTVRTVQRVTVEAPERTERVVRTVVSSSLQGDGGSGYGDAESALKDLQERLTKSEIGETASWTMGDHPWETMAQYSQDTSPGSGNGGTDVFANSNSNHNNKNSGSTRHDVHSDTDSDGSPQPRRRSPSKRRTLGSSSGSDVALHEGAELSPLEDDQGTALSQLNLLSKRCTYPTPNLFSDFGYFGNESKEKENIVMCVCIYIDCVIIC